MIGTTLNQRFKLDKELGRGGMGAVYSATDQVLGRKVAIKVLKALTGVEVGKRIKLEAQISARLLHENIVRLYDIGEADGTYYLVMEEVEGSSFQKRLRKVSVRERFRIVAQVAEALDYAHRQGVIHRDIKPANVLLTASDQSKLTDFGLSLMAGAPDEPGVVRGTPHYMSPEQALGRKLDHRTDLYSLGVILYESATGTMPFSGTPREIMGMQVNLQPEPPRSRRPDISTDVERLILSLLSKDPNGRPATGSATAKAIRTLIETDPCLRDDRIAETAAGASPAAVPQSLPSQALQGNGAVPSVLAPGRPSHAIPSISSLEKTTPAFDPNAPALALAEFMIDLVESEPIELSPEDRYRCGHYLAYLLGGSKREGILGKRPLDERNADRARLLLAMSSIMIQNASESSITLAATLLEQRPEIRPRLSPIVVAKYLYSRETNAKRRQFRQARSKLQEASKYATENLLDPNGVLNPGLMPQTLADLDRIAPPRTEVDDQLVGRWNLVAGVWRSNAPFRNAVLHYATRSAGNDPASYKLWPEVVYPLIERARWQRRNRTQLEALKDMLLGKVLRIRDSGLKLDFEIGAAISQVVVNELDHSVHAFAVDPELIDEPLDDAVDREVEGLASLVSAASIREIVVDQPPGPRAHVPLVQDDPLMRLTLAELGELWREAYASLTSGTPGATGTRAGLRHFPIGSYRLAVIATIRGKSAGQVAIQGMANKQIEILVPSLRIAGNKAVSALAIWLYRDQSLVVTYLNNRYIPRFVQWNAPTSQQSNFDHPGDLVKALIASGMEVPEHLEDVLTKQYKPKKPV